ncbi:MAG: tripartite tricarboxylate transporter TctB family protein [Clostridia bacterium]
MSKKKASIVSEIIVIIIGLYFLVTTYTFPYGDGMIIPPSYYPRLVSILMILFGLASLYRDIFGADKNNKDQLEITNIKNFFLMIILAVIIVVSWKFFGLFYLAAFLCTAVALFCLNPAPNSTKKKILSICISVGFTIFVYVSFEILLKIKL